LQLFAVSSHLLSAAKKGSYLRDISWDSQIANGAEIRVFGSDAMLRYGVIVEGYFRHAKFDFASFNLYAGFGATA
jgi:hypothetical protein